MVVWCCVYTCTNHTAKNSNISFYKFPLKEKERLNQWITAIKRKKFVPNRYTRICSEHFTPECFLRNYVNTKKLKGNAVPTVFDFSDNLHKPLRSCVAASCKNTNRNCNLSFFTIPGNDQSRLKKWLANIEMKASFKGKKYLCSDHFEVQSCTNASKRRLLLSAVPTIQKPGQRGKRVPYPCLDEDANTVGSPGKQGGLSINGGTNISKKCENVTTEVAAFEKHERKCDKCGMLLPFIKYYRHRVSCTGNLGKSFLSCPHCRRKFQLLSLYHRHRTTCLKSMVKKLESNLFAFALPEKPKGNSVERRNSFEGENYGVWSDNSECNTNSLPAKFSIASSNFRYCCKTCNKVFISYDYLENHFNKNSACYKFKSYKVIDSSKVVEDNTWTRTARKSFPALYSSISKAIEKEYTDLVKSEANLTSMEKHSSEKTFTGSARKSSHNNRSALRKYALDTNHLPSTDFNEVFPNSEVLHKHMKKHSEYTLDSSFERKWCSTIFSQSNHLNLQVQREHKDVLGFECVMCGLHYLSQIEALQHVVKVHFIDLAKHCIKVCEIPADQQVEKEMKKVTVLEKDGGSISKVCENNKPRISGKNGEDVGNFYCDVCEINFLKLCGLQSHRQSRHHRNCLINKNQAAVAMVTTETLKDKTPISIPSLSPQHSEQSSKAPNVKKLECSVCLQIFNGIIDFVPHRLSHFSEQNLSEISEENPYHCEICSNVVDHRQKVQWHLLHHLQMGKLNVKPSAELTFGSRRRSGNISQKLEKNLEKSIEVQVAKKSCKSRLN